MREKDRVLQPEGNFHQNVSPASRVHGTEAFQICLFHCLGKIARPTLASQAPHSPNIRVLERELGCGMLRDPCMAAFVSHTQRGKCLPVPKPPAQSCQAVPTRFSS